MRPIAARAEPAVSADADLIAVCTEFDDLKRQTGIIHGTGPDCVVDDDEANVISAPLFARRHALLDRMDELHTTTPAGILARAHIQYSPTFGTAVIAAACYCPGSLILTGRGEMPVELLAIGDVVVTASGEQRAMFHNAHEFAALYPDAPQPGRFCAPKVDDGYELEAIRRRLACSGWRDGAGGLAHVQQGRVVVDAVSACDGVVKPVRAPEGWRRRVGDDSARDRHAKACLRFPIAN